MRTLGCCWCCCYCWQWYGWYYYCCCYCCSYPEDLSCCFHGCCDGCCCCCCLRHGHCCYCLVQMSCICCQCCCCGFDSMCWTPANEEPSFEVVENGYKSRVGFWGCTDSCKAMATRRCKPPPGPFHVPSVRRGRLVAASATPLLRARVLCMCGTGT